MGKSQSKLMRKLSPTFKMLQLSASNHIYNYCMCWTKIVGILWSTVTRHSLRERERERERVEGEREREKQTC